ncbi:MAG: rhamnulokinase family protein [Chloroflexota bacterium]|nr:rhamnulokinase family protein [Chloroflexota bacterium]
MPATANFLAVDLGASGGRVMLGRWDGARFALEELHRFPNGPVNLLGRLHWDHLRLWTEIKQGLSRYAARYDEPAAGIGVDTWGVDYALLDRNGALLGNPFHYRDPGTNGILEEAFKRVPRDQIYQVTGLQFIQFNTLFQLLSRKLSEDPQLDLAKTLLMTPDLFAYWLTGETVVEYTVASTSQMLDARTRQWATGLLKQLELPMDILAPLVEPGSVVGRLLPAVAAELGLSPDVPVIATGSHDTASAVAAVPGLDSKSAYISSGTWSLVGMEWPEPVINEQALALDFTNEGGVGDTFRLLKNLTGLWLLQESRRQWQREGRQDLDWGQLIDQAREAEPLQSLIDPDAADFAAPGDMPAAIRSYCQRTGQAVPESVGAMVRCCLESLALKSIGLVDAVQALTGSRVDTIRIVGGGTQNRLLNQFIADASGRQVVAGPVEATALGNIMIQAIATGHLDSIAAGRQAVAESTGRDRYEPLPDSRWKEGFERLNSLAV